MAVPKKKTSKSKRNMRRSHDALRQRYAIICPNCGEPMQRYHVCTSCGQYRGRQVLKVAAEVE
ncbi:MAG: 50S ribosomal protein L32 [Candidatus Dadabacteria bacterium]|nr:MAG: 50S ribosomal protein L32 [Candidatus Dadabacteria bacterium]